MRTYLVSFAALLVLGAACSSSPGADPDTGSELVATPLITAVEPAVVTVLGGTRITIRGSDLTYAPRVWIGGVEVPNVTVGPDESLLVTTLPHTAGPVDVQVGTDGGENVLTRGLTFAVPPHIERVEPSVGNVSGGETVTVTGSHFDFDDLEVTFGDLPLSNLVRVDANTVQGTTPAEVAGTVDVRVDSEVGSEVLPRGFEFRVWTGSQRGMDEAEISAVATTPNDPDRMYVASRGGSIFRSADRGQTWEEVATGITHGGQNFLVTGLHDPDVLLAICQEAQVCRSVNGGESWRPVISDCCANSIVSDPGTAAIYVAALNYVARSVDDGATWTMLYRGGQGFTRLAVDPALPSRLYGLSPGGHVLRSENSGESWSVIGAGVPADEYLSDILPTMTSGRVVVSSWNSGLYWSADSGGAFTAASEPSLPEGVCCTPGYERVLRDPQLAGRLVAGGNLVVESIDEGSSWTQLGPVPPGRVLTMNLFDQALFVGTDASGLFELVSGSWTPRNTGLSSPTATVVGLGQNGDLFAATRPGRVYRSDDTGESWSQVGEGMTGVIESVGSLQGPRGTRFFAHVNGLMQFIAPDSTTWASEHSLQWVAADPVTPGRALGSSVAGTFLTLDGGDTWTAIAFPSAAEILALAPHVTSEGTEFYALTSDGLYRLATDGTWSVAGPGLSERPWKLVATPGGSLVASQGSSGSGRIWRLAPGADAWAEIEPPGAWGLGAALTGPDMVVIGLYQSASISRDGGATWTTVPLPIGSAGSDFLVDLENPQHVIGALGTRGILQSRTGLH